MLGKKGLAEAKKAPDDAFPMVISFMPEGSACPWFQDALAWKCNFQICGEEMGSITFLEA